MIDNFGTELDLWREQRENRILRKDLGIEDEIKEEINGGNN